MVKVAMFDSKQYDIDSFESLKSSKFYSKIIKNGQKISCAIRKIYGNSLGIPSNKMQEKTK